MADRQQSLFLVEPDPDAASNAAGAASDQASHPLAATTEPVGRRELRTETSKPHSVSHKLDSTADPRPDHHSDPRPTSPPDPRPPDPTNPTDPTDQPARHAALNPRQSILVQAPAGAGKTSLLTQRYLALLAQVDEPEQILAITFTRAATAEMRDRILSALQAARQQPDPTPSERDEISLARRALRHADSLRWRILEQPHRLDVQTIDSLCLRLAHGQPLLARLGGALQPAEDAQALYAAAARRTTALLGHTRSPELDHALRRLLLRRDNNLSELERLLAGMLARRDAWLGVLPLPSSSAAPHDRDWQAIRNRLEQPFADEIHRVLAELRAAFTAMPELSRDLLTAVRYAAENLAEPPGRGPGLSPLRTLHTLPGDHPEQLPVWEALTVILLTGDNAWRQGFDKRVGFPAADSGPGKDQRKRFKDLIKACSSGLQAHASGGEALLQLLCRLRTLPSLHYSDDQWQTLLAVFHVLRRATAELRLVFAETDTVDFVELAQAAHSVLSDPASMRGLLESEHKQHLLIDEFQDTSRSQFRLIEQLLREWQHGDGRTVFLVGDPLQSIYAFRQAEVALFHETRAHGLPCGDGRRHPCEPLQLTHNFRSHQALVEQLNRYFTQIFPASPSGKRLQAREAADNFIPAYATPVPGIDAAHSLTLHTFFAERTAAASRSSSTPADPVEPGRDAADESPENATLAARRREAAKVVRILLDELPRIAAAQAAGEPEYRVALLVRSRSHLASILPALREAHIPFRAVDLDPLADQPEIQDLTLLLRALLHPADRVAWLAVLRAPWCGLSLADLHLVTGADDPDLLRRSIPERIEAVLDPPSDAPPQAFTSDGLLHLRRTWHALSTALRTRTATQSSLAPWIERTWMALGGPACVTATARDNAETFFRLLDTLSPSGVEVFRGDFDLRLARLCAAPDSRVSERFGVQIMTIHKAKGLGFQVVLLPGLERKEPANGTELIAMLERAGTTPAPDADTPADEAADEATDEAGDPAPSELLLAPFSHRDADDKDRLYDWVKKQREAREAAERKRLFYVACTRARLRLHLFATVSATNGRLRSPEKCSLLGAAWPALASQVEAAFEHQQKTTATGLTLAASADISAAAAMERARATGDAAPLIATRSQTSPATAARNVLATNPETIERLPANWKPSPWAHDVLLRKSERTVSGEPRPFARSEGSLAARARGTAMHALLERLTLLFAEQTFAEQTPADQTSAEQTHAEHSLTAAWRGTLTRAAEHTLRAAAFPADRLRATAAELTRTALAVAGDPIGRWLLSPHPGALAESTWQLLDSGLTLRTLRVDRSFFAGRAPLEAGDTHLWIVDYKTGVQNGQIGQRSSDTDGSTSPDRLLDPAHRDTWLAEQRSLYEPQLAAYGAALAATTGPEAKPIRYGLYFPELLHLLHWPAESLD